MAVDYSTNPAVFDKQVTLFREYTVFDEMNNPRSEWHPFAVVMVAIEALTGREYWLASQSQGEGSVRVTMRYRKGITDRIRIKYESEDGPVMLEPKSPPVNIREQNKYYEIMCRELSNDSD